MKRIKILVLALVMIMMFTTLAYAEGLSPHIKNNDEKKVWHYIDKDNVIVSNEWKYIADNWYYFGDDGNSKNNTWAEINDKWYYFDSKSIMLHDTVTPDGYTVGSDGAWIESEPQITESIPTTEAVEPGIN